MRCRPKRGEANVEKKLILMLSLHGQITVAALSGLKEKENYHYQYIKILTLWVRSLIFITSASRDRGCVISIISNSCEELLDFATL